MNLMQTLAELPFVAGDPALDFVNTAEQRGHPLAGDVLHTSNDLRVWGERYDLLPGSAFDVAYGGPFDIVLLTNFLHHFDPPTCTKLLKKVRASLKPGGRAVTLEFVPNPDRVSPPMPAGFSLTMLVTTTAGDAWTFRELEAMYKDAGLDSVTAHPLPPGTQTAVVGMRPR